MATVRHCTARPVLPPGSGAVRFRHRTLRRNGAAGLLHPVAEQSAPGTPIGTGWAAGKGTVTRGDDGARTRRTSAARSRVAPPVRSVAPLLEGPLQHRVDHPGDPADARQDGEGQPEGHRPPGGPNGGVNRLEGTACCHAFSLPIEWRSGIRTGPQVYVPGSRRPASARGGTEWGLSGTGSGPVVDTLRTSAKREFNWDLVPHQATFAPP